MASALQISSASTPGEVLNDYWAKRPSMKNSGALNRPSGELTGGKSKKGTTGKLISAHYLEIGYLLDRIDGATTHYQLLGVERSATEDAIVQAYHEAIAVLHPTYHK